MNREPEPRTTNQERRTVSELDLDDSSNRQGADHLQHQRKQNHPDAERVGNECAHVLRRHQRQQHKDHWGHQRQNPSRDPSMGACHPDLALHPRSLTDQARQVIEDLCEVTAGFSLREHGGYKEPGVEEWHAPSERFQGIGKRHAEVLLVVRAA